MTTLKKTKKDNDSKAVAFVNWSLPKADGTSIRSSKGFVIFKNEQIPNRHEDMLVRLAEKHGGSVEVTMKCKIVLNKSINPNEINLDDIVIDE